MEQLGHVRAVADVLESLNIKFRVFSNVLPDPNIANINEALAIANSWQPDIIIGLGGGSAMDEAKMVWLLYENPDTSFEDIA